MELWTALGSSRETRPSFNSSRGYEDDPLLKLAIDTEQVMMLDRGRSLRQKYDSSDGSKPASEGANLHPRSCKGCRRAIL